MRETICCTFDNRRSLVGERKAFGWHVVEEELHSGYCKIIFEMDDNLPNKEELLRLYNQYTIRNEVKKPHTVASFVWGSLLFWISSLVLFIIAVEDPAMYTDPDYAPITFIMLGTPWLSGLLMITMGIVFRIKYVKRSNQVVQEKMSLMLQAEEITNSQPLE